MRTTSALLALLLTVLCFEVSAAKPRKQSAGGLRKSAAVAKGSHSKARNAPKQYAKGKKGRVSVSRSSRPARQTTPSSERYSEIQKALAAKGFYNGSTDGAWDSGSAEALKRFQAANDLKPDGKLGSLTLIALGLGPRHESSSALE